MSRTARGKRSFGDRLTVAVTMVCGVAVLAVAAPLAILHYSNLRRESFAAAHSQSALVSLDLGAALVFNDAAYASQALGNLRAAREIAAAVVFDESGQPFATYQRAEDPAPLPEVEPPGERRLGRWLVLVEPIVDLGTRQGQLEIVYDLRPLSRRLRAGVLLAIAVSLGAMAVAYLVARRVRRGLVAPIDELARATAEVSRTGDYSQRAARLSDDELGQLTDAWNEMLERIQGQAQDLGAAHAERGALLEREREARAEAEHANRMKDEFLATLSHELRTPLTPILGWIEILKSGELGSEQVRRAIDILERNARLLTRIIDDLLDMSRIVSGKVRLEMQRVELPSIVDAAVAAVRPAAEARSIRIHLAADPRARWVRGDAARLQQVVFNLLSNAIRFTPKDGRVDVASRRLDSRVEIVVADSGEGIGPDFLPHVFDRFRQADSSTSRRHGGLGLGLAIVRQLVELHGGDVRAESEGEGRGATFTVSLPALEETDSGREPEPAAGLEAAHRESRPLSGLRILVVDDEPDARDLLAVLLESYGAEVMLAGSALEALATLRRRLPDVMMSDIGMPEVDGYELIRRVRALSPEQGGATPAIALTAFARDEDRARALQAGYQLHLAKPVVAAELVAALAHVRAGEDRKA